MSLKSTWLDLGAISRAILIFAGVTLFGRSGIAGEAGDFEKKLDEILPGLSSADSAVSVRARQALGSLCLDAGQAGAEADRRSAARALAAKLGPEVPAEARVAIVRQLQAFGRDESVAALAALLKDGNPPALWEAARLTLTANPAPQAMRALRQAYAASAGDARAALIQSLGVRRDSLSVGSLLDDARSEESAVRVEALGALAEIGDRAAVDVFEEALQKDGADAAKIHRAYLRLAETLGEGEEGGAARRIYLQALKWSPAERLAAITGLGRAGIIADARVLLAALSEADPQVRGAARDALVALRGGTKPIADQLEKAPPEMQKQLVGILGRRGDPAAAAALLALTKDPDEGIRAAAIEALERPPAAATGESRVGAQLYIWTQHFGARKEKIEDHLDEVLEKCRKAGFGSVQGWLSDFDTPEAAARIGGLLSRHQLAMPAAYTGGGFHAEAGAGKAIENILRQARLGKPQGLKIVVLNPDAIGREKTDGELAVQARQLDRLGGALREFGLRLAIHTHDPEMRDGAREWYHILRSTDPEKVGFCLDLHWVLRGKQDPYRLLEDAGKRTLDLHLRNSKAGVWMEDLGDGDIDYSRIRKILDGLGYPGLYTVELAYEAGTRPVRGLEEDLRRSREYIRTVFGE